MNKINFKLSTLYFENVIQDSFINAFRFNPLPSHRVECVNFIINAK